MVIHRLWRTDTGPCVVAYRVEAAVPGLVTVVDDTVGSRLSGHPRFFVWRRPDVERPWQKLTVLWPGANSSATLHQSVLDGGVPWCRLGYWAVDRDRIGTERRRFDLGKSRQYPRTVARKWRYGCDSDHWVYAPELASETNKSYALRLLSDGHELVVGGMGAGATVIEEKQPWPRASGRSSRTIGVVPRCTVSGCGCGPGLGAPSCPAGAARAVARSLRDSAVLSGV